MYEFCDLNADKNPPEATAGCQKVMTDRSSKSTRYAVYLGTIWPQTDAFNTNTNYLLNDNHDSLFIIT